MDEIDDAVKDADTVSVSYDREADILYITLHEDVDAVAEHAAPHVIVRRHPDTQEIVGITIEDFEKTAGLGTDAVTIPWNVPA